MTASPPIDRVRHPEKAKRPDSPVQRKPDWIRVKAPVSTEYNETRKLMRGLKLNTVCEEAACPNIGECWKKKHATFMILGAVCTRACAFCNVATGRPDLLDPHEPDNVAEAVGTLGLEHVVITSVDRDDLDDGGADHFARTIRRIRETAPATTIEILTPDFMRKKGAVETCRGGASRRLQPQPGNRAPALSDDPSRCPLLYLPQPVVPCEGTGTRHLHQVRHHGRPGRNQGRGNAGDGRPSGRRRGFPDHRSVSPAHAEARSRSTASSRRTSSPAMPRIARGKGFLMVSGFAADPLVLPCRRRLPPDARCP